MDKSTEKLNEIPLLQPVVKSNRIGWFVIAIVLLLIAFGLQWSASYANTHWLQKSKKTHYDSREKNHTSLLPLEAPVKEQPSVQQHPPLDVKTYIAEHKEEPKGVDDELTRLRLLERIKNQEERHKRDNEMLDSDGFIAMGVSSSQPNVATQNTNSLNQNPNTDYLNSVSGRNVDEIPVQTLGDLRFRILKGSVLQGVTESAIDSDLPNIIRAHVTEDVYGEEGDTPLIHNGDKLVGEYRSGDIRNGQIRLYVVWTRLILQGGFSLNLDSSGSDPLGRAGMSGAVDHHFLERYGSAFLMSSISASASLLGVDNAARYNSQAAFRQGISSSFSQTATGELQQNMAIQNSIRPPQGTLISILVNHDLTFDNTRLQKG